MIKANKANTIILMAANGGFPFDGYVAEGYHTYAVYKPTNILTRIIREVCFRLPILPKTVWYNKKILDSDVGYIYVRDAIITREYLLWLRKKFPRAQVNFSYENMVGRAHHLMPEQIPEGIRVWTFDPNDSEKYGIKLKKVIPYFRCYVKEAKEKKYDLLFVGRDKGRGDWLKQLEGYLNERGIKTKFLIAADGKFSKRKSYYENPVSYDKLTDWVAESRALLNVGMENQKGITMRDIESYFNQTKLVTTNLNIKESDIFDSSNTFFLTDNNWSELVGFLKREFQNNIEITWKNHTIDDAIEEITAFED